MHIGLALSGGGFRATLYHLGIVRFLKDAGLLESVTHMTSVSGGSVIAAHLALNWDRYNGSPEEFDDVSQEIIDFVRLDVRNRIVRRYPFTLAHGLLLGLMRRHPGRRMSRTGMLEQHYQKYLFGDTCVYELPATPELHILGTSLSEGGLFSFNRSGLLCQDRAEPGGTEMRSHPVGLTTVPMAVAASSAFPGFFPPVLLSAGDIGLTVGEFKTQHLTDGGVYDNLGVRMFQYLGRNGGQGRKYSVVPEGFDAIIASDAGRRFQVEATDKAGTFLRGTLRSSDVLMDRVWQLENEHFADSEQLIFAPITRIISEEEDPTALHPELQIQTGRIRTDMDRFGDHEISALIRHGYCVARQSLATHPVLATYSCEARPWDPISDREPNEGRPGSTRGRGSKASGTTKEARRLHQSSERTFRSILSPRDWVTYMYLPLLALLLGWIPFLIYTSWNQARVTSLLTTAVAEARPDVNTLLTLIMQGPVEPWAGMDFVEVEQLDSLFADNGLDIITDTRIMDLRNIQTAGGRTGEHGPRQVYMYRLVSVRKTSHTERETGLLLQSLRDFPNPIVRCSNEGLAPQLKRTAIESAGEDEPGYEWQLNLDFTGVPVGRTVNIIMEALMPAGPVQPASRGRKWWEFEVDAGPEVATDWLLLPDGWPRDDAQLVRFPNGKPDEHEVVAPTHHSSIFGDSILNWIVVHPKVGYTYTYRWHDDP